MYVQIRSIRDYEGQGFYRRASRPNTPADFKDNYMANSKMIETTGDFTAHTNIHAQYWSEIAESYLNINLYDLPESSMAAARKAIEGYRKRYPAGTTDFRILIESVQRTQVDIEYPLTVH